MISNNQLGDCFAICLLDMIPGILARKVKKSIVIASRFNHSNRKKNLIPTRQSQRVIGFPIDVEIVSFRKIRRTISTDLEYALSNAKSGGMIPALHLLIYQTSLILCSVSSNASGKTRVSPTDVIKFVSPDQRGKI
jgi:hypothetical protein